MTQLKTKKKITLATVKSFIKKNKDNLYIRVDSKFDGMTDCVESVDNDGFEKVQLMNPEDRNYEYRLGIPSAWFVRDSRDYFDPYEDKQFLGISVWNSCGSFVIVRKKTENEMMLSELSK